MKRFCLFLGEDISQCEMAWTPNENKNSSEKAVCVYVVFYLSKPPFLGLY